MYDKNRLEAFNYLALSLVWENMACEGQKMYELYFHWDLTMVFHQSSSRSMQITLLLKMFVLVITWFRVLTMGHHNFLSPFGKEIYLLKFMRNFLLERGINLKRMGEGGGVWCRNWGGGGCHFFITLKFNHIYFVWGESKVPFITFWIFSLFSKPCKILIQVFIVLKPDIICTFLIHSGNLLGRLI